MSTSNVPAPTNVPGTVTATFVTDVVRVLTLPARISAYVVTHEKLLLAGLAALVLWYGIGKVEAVIKAHDQHNLAVAQATLAATTAHNAVLDAQAQRDTAAATAATQVAAQANLRLAQSNNALAAALAKQQAADKTLPPPALAQRIETLAGAPAGSVTPGPGGYTVTQDGAVQIAVALESVPTLIAQLKNTQDMARNTQTALDTRTMEATDLHSEVAGLKTQITQADTVCTDRLKVQHDKDVATGNKKAIFAAIIGFVFHAALHGGL